MALPFLDRAQIPPAKIRDYLLNPEHPVGRARARFSPDGTPPLSLP
jgi:hypothetical protein